MHEASARTVTRFVAVAAVVLVALAVRPGGAGAAVVADPLARPPAGGPVVGGTAGPATVTDTIPVEVSCSSSVPVPFDRWLQDLQLTVTHPATVPFGSLADVSLSATFVTDSGIPSDGGHWGEASFVTAPGDPAGFAPTFGDPHLEVAGPAATHTIGPVAFDDVEAPGLPGQLWTTTLTSVELAVHIPWRGSSMVLRGHCVPAAPIPLLAVPIVDPGPGQTVGDHVVVTVHRADGSLLAAVAGFTDGNAFTFVRGAQNAVHAVVGVGRVPGPAGEAVPLGLVGVARQGPGGAPELPDAPGFALLLRDPTTDLLVEAGLRPGAASGLVQLSATGPQARTVAGVALGSARRVGASGASPEPVVIRWQVRDLV